MIEWIIKRNETKFTDENENEKEKYSHGLLNLELRRNWDKETNKFNSNITNFRSSISNSIEYQIKNKI